LKSSASVDNREPGRDFADLDHYPIDARALARYYAFIGAKRLGAGHFFNIGKPAIRGRKTTCASTWV
jgi:hypothetical protein